MSSASDPLEIRTRASDPLENVLMSSDNDPLGPARELALRDWTALIPD